MITYKQVHMSDSEYVNECDRQHQARRAYYEAKRREAAVVEAERKHGWMSIEAADARSAYQAARATK
jgi:hypothetical protein